MIQYIKIFANAHLMYYTVKLTNTLVIRSVYRVENYANDLVLNKARTLIL